MSDYDDLLPVRLHTSPNGLRYLLDRHYDLIATFRVAIDAADCQRIVDLINRGTA